MRRKVRGTVSGIYMYSAALGVLKTPSRLHVLCFGSATKRVFAFCQMGAIRLNPRSITSLASMRAPAR